MISLGLRGANVTRKGGKNWCCRGAGASLWTEPRVTEAEASDLIPQLHLTSPYPPQLPIPVLLTSSRHALLSPTDNKQTLDRRPDQSSFIPVIPNRQLFRNKLNFTGFTIVTRKSQSWLTFLQLATALFLLYFRAAISALLSGSMSST